MKSGQLTDVAEQDRLQENTPQRPRKVERYPLSQSDMKLDEKSIALLSTIKRRLPLFMPQKFKLRLIDKVAMHAAVVAVERGATHVSVDDVLIGIHQALPARLVNYIYPKLQITPAKRDEYQQKSLDMDYISMDAFLKDLKVHAEKCGAQIREDIVERHSLYVKTTTKDSSPRELFIRPGHSGRWFDLAAMAKERGVVDLYDNQAYKAYSSICSRIDVLGSMVDISIQGDIQKFYAFFSHKAEPISKIRKCKYVPESIFKNSALLESWGFKRFSIFGVDFKNNSLNLYYYTDQTEFNKTKVESILTSLGFPLPSEEMLLRMEDVTAVYFTFTHTSDQIERVCFTKIYEDDVEEALELAPSLRDFIEQAPLKSAKRNLLLGFAFNKKGHFLKAELDYKASLQIPKGMKFTGLYSNPDEF
jgi:hypothetical protein